MKKWIKYFHPPNFIRNEFTFSVCFWKLKTSVFGNKDFSAFWLWKRITLLKWNWLSGSSIPDSLLKCTWVRRWTSPTINKVHAVWQNVFSVPETRWRISECKKVPRNEWMNNSFINSHFDSHIRALVLIWFWHLSNTTLVVSVCSVFLLLPGSAMQAKRHCKVRDEINFRDAQPVMDLKLRPLDHSCSVVLRYYTRTKFGSSKCGTRERITSAGSSIIWFFRLHNLKTFSKRDWTSTLIYTAGINNGNVITTGACFVLRAKETSLVNNFPSNKPINSVA